MKSRIAMIIAAALLTAMFLAGCTDKTKDNPTRPMVSDNGLVFVNPWHFYSIFFSTSLDPGYMPSLVYTPPGYAYEGSGRPYPVLYLLSPFRGDDRYYFEHGLADVADRLIDEGSIQPMIIVSIDGRSQFGGSFYTNSPIQGNYYSALAEDRIFHVDPYIDPNAFPFPIDGPRDLYSYSTVSRMDETYLTIDNPKARAISGVGMGGYGAFAAAVQTDLFGSVSAINAPLDFDGAGAGGFKALFNEVFTTPNHWTVIDTSETGRIDTNYIVDTALNNPALSLVVSAAGAFSPHYTSFDIDSVFNDQFGVQTWAFTITGSQDDPALGKTYLPRHQVHVPFDSTGVINDVIWGQWMDRNIESLYQNDTLGYAAAFDTIPKLLIRSADAKFHYGEQMDAFMKFMTDNGIRYEAMTFRGTDRLTGTVDHFLYDLLVDILIFHSQNFEIPPDIEGR